MAFTDHLTERARRVLDDAMRTAREFRHAEVGVEHVLLAMIADGASMALPIVSARIDVELLRSAMSRTAPSVAAQPHLRPAAKEGLEHAQQVADSVGARFITPDHLLLALLGTSESSSPVLARLGLDGKALGAELQAALSASASRGKRVTSNLGGTLATGVSSKQMERLSPRSRKVLAVARKQSAEHDLPHVTTTILLQALLDEEGGRAKQLLPQVGVDGRRLAAAIATETSRASPNTVLTGTPLSLHALEIIRRAGEEADDLGATSVEPEHLFIALLRHEGCGATRALVDIGADVHRLAALATNELG